MVFAVGSLVKARGREWVVLPESTETLVLVRPLGGTAEEETGIFLPLERVESAQFAPPDPTQPGDFRSSRLLRDAVRLGFRSSAGPFRSFARIAVDPRPYQLVPLLMALKLDPIRLLIADDVGIGKTVEAGLIVRELLDRGEIARLAVLCPPPLAEQWQRELREKFNIDAELVLPSTVSRLERGLGFGESLFDRHPFVVVSLDYIKSDRHRADFLRTCPECVIVDEAHTCAYGGEGRGGQHQRHQLITSLAAHPDRHLILISATPHSGNEAAFHSLLAFLAPAFGALPEDLSRSENTAIRKQLARHFVQRRRPDIRAYLDTDTPFPVREELPEQGYKLSVPYYHLLDRVLRYVRETVTEPGGTAHRQRVRWWSALALLRSIASSPAAAAATLRTRAAAAETATVAEADEIGRRTVFDQIEDEASEGIDVAPGSDPGEDSGEESRLHRRLTDMAREAEALRPADDAKLLKAIAVVSELLAAGFSPIVFCRFIATADYVAGALRAQLRGVTVDAVTGQLPPAEREKRVADLGTAPKCVLVATDCLSEGINLQEHFNAVMHYDLSWNPTRHEQREGRVDRYGQPHRTVRMATLYGTDNQIDGVVLDVLIRKHKAIRNELGISVPIPADTNQVVEAIFEGLLLREGHGNAQPYMPGFEALLKPQTLAVLGEWRATAEKERRSQTVFAQEGIRVDDVRRELDSVRAAIGSGIDVAAFVRDALAAHGASVIGSAPLIVNMHGTPQALRDVVGLGDAFRARFELPVQDGEIALNRTHPAVEGLATYVLDTAIDPIADSVARRCGVIRTAQVAERTTLLLLRFRYHIVSPGRDGVARPLLAEDCQLVAFSGAAASGRWLPPDAATALLDITPDQNMPPDLARDALRRVLAEVETLQPYLNGVAEARGREILAAHVRVRTVPRGRGAVPTIETQLPPDVLGLFVYLPKPPGGP